MSLRKKLESSTHPEVPSCADLASFRLGRSHPFELDAADLLSDAGNEISRIRAGCSLAISALGSGYSQAAFDAHYRYEPFFTAAEELRRLFADLLDRPQGDLSPRQQRILWLLDQALSDRPPARSSSLEGFEQLLREGARRAETLGIWTVAATHGPSDLPSAVESEMPYGFDPRELPYPPVSLKTFFDDADLLDRAADLVGVIRRFQSGPPRRYLISPAA